MDLTRQCLLSVLGAGWLGVPLRACLRTPQDEKEWMAKRRRVNLERDVVALHERESELWVLRSSGHASGMFLPHTGFGSRQ